MQPIHRTLVLGASTVFAAPLFAAAQFPVQGFQGEDAGDAFGFSVANAGDVSGDGRPEIVIGAPKAKAGGLGSGSAYVYSLASGALLHRFDGMQGENLGWSVAGAGDVDGDGFADLIVGLPSAGQGAPLRGAAHVYSGKDGALLYAFEGMFQFDRFGTAVASAGDVDGDGHSDVVVGAPNAGLSGFGSGAAFVYSGKTGRVMRVVAGDVGGDQLGSAVAGVGDLNLDGHADFALGAPYSGLGGHHAGLVRVHSGKDGAVLFAILGPAPGAQLGRSIAGVGDLNGDGRPDFAVGAPFADVVLLISGANGSVLRVHAGTPGTRFGTALAAAGDVDGDGVPDLLVGAPEEGGGTLRIYSGADGSLLQLVTAAGANDRLGAAVAGAFDWNGDQRAEYAAGAWLADAPAVDSGEVIVYSDVDPLGGSYCFGDGSGSPCPCGNPGAAGEGCANSSGAGALLAASGSASVAADDLTFTASQLLALQPALLFAGINAVNGGQGAIFGDGLRCAGGGVTRLGVAVPDAGGSAHFGPGLAAIGDFAPGDLRRFQVWYRDPSGSPCGSGFNLSPGHELTFGP